MGREPTNYIEEVDAGKILAEIREKKPVLWRNVIIKGNLTINDLNLPRKNPIIVSRISITNCRIDGSINFRDAIFKNDVIFHHNQFFGIAFFEGARFCKGANFEFAQFEDNANFKEAKFHSAVFAIVKFNGYANFDKAHFCKDDNSSCIFDSAQFRDYANFKGAHFDANASFNWASFTDFANFEDAKFKGYAHFENVTFKDGLFENASFSGKNQLSMNRAQYEKLFIKWADLYKPNYTLNFRKYKFFDIGKGENHLSYNDTIYITLIENFKNLGFFEDADNCYYYYRIRYREKKDLIFKGLDCFLMLSYGYGVKPLRPLLCSLIFILLFGALYALIGEYIGFARAVPVWESLNISLTLLLSGTKLIADPEYAATGLLFWIFNLEKIIGSLYLGFFILSIGKMVIR